MAELSTLQLAVPAADIVIERVRPLLPYGSTVLDPAHISFGYPWLEPDAARGVVDEVQEALADCSPVTVDLHGPRRFPPDHRGRTVLWLEPRPAEPIREISRVITRVSGRPRDFRPHCSIVRLGEGVDPTPFEQVIDDALPLHATLDTIELHIRQLGQWRPERSITLTAAPQPAVPKLFILVGGPPAAGKSTLARQLAEALGLPLITKDTIKHALFDTLGEPDDLERSRELGRAGVLAMLAVAADNTGAVLDSTWYPYAIDAVRNLSSAVVEVRCACPPDILRERYRGRMPSRRRGDLQALRSPDELEADVHSEALGVGPLVTVDTSGPVDIAALTHRILAAAS